MKLLFSTIFLIVLVAVAIYWTPTKIKIKGMEIVAGIVPESLKEKAEELILSPSEKRARLIAQLEAELENLKGDYSDSELEQFIENSKTTLNELKEKSQDASIKEIITSKLVDKLINNKDTTPANDAPERCLN